MSVIFRIVTFLLPLAWISTVGQTARAERIVDAHIRLLDRHVVLRASEADDGRADSDAVWQYLKEIRFRDSRDIAILPDADDPLRATLRGEIRVAIRYGGSIRVSLLTLVREKKTANEWAILPEQVDKMQPARNRSYENSGAKRLDLEAEQRNRLWAGLRKSLPDDAGPIEAYAENDDLTVVCFRSKRETFLFRTKTGKVEPVLHAKVLPPPVNRITYFVNDRDVGKFRLWHDCEVELTISSPD